MGCGRRPIFYFFGSKSLGKRYGNALKTYFLHRKSYFLSVKVQNVRACGAAKGRKGKEIHSAQLENEEITLFKGMVTEVSKSVWRRYETDDFSEHSNRQNAPIATKI